MKTQLVPVEPTKKMLDAFDAQDSLHYNPANKSEQYKARHAWKAMLKAAPTPEDEPAAWIVLDRFGDRRGFETRSDAAEKLKESGCKLIPLYTRPDNNNSKLRKAAEEAIGIINDAIERLDDVPCRIVMRLHDAVENLRAALNKGES